MSQEGRVVSMGVKILLLCCATFRKATCLSGRQTNSCEHQSVLQVVQRVGVYEHSPAVAPGVSGCLRVTVTGSLLICAVRGMPSFLDRAVGRKGCRVRMGKD